MSYERGLVILARLVCCLVLWLAGSVSVATDADSLYEAEAPVAGKTPSERARAIREALSEVLVRVSGRGDVGQAPEVAAMLDRAMDYVQQYRYGGAGAADVPSREDGLVLWVRFDAAAVDEGLRSRKLPVWSGVRPTTLVWMAVEQNGQRYILDANSTNAAAAAIAVQAKRRGVPVLLPLMDLEDRGNLTASDIWGNFRDNILVASNRYGTEAVLVGRVFKTTTLWQAHWSLYQGGQATYREARGTLAEVAAAGVDNAADTLAAMFAPVVGSGTSTLLMKISGVRTLADYAGTVRYLESLGLIDAAEAVFVDRQSVIFRLRARTDRHGLVQALALSSERRLVPDAAPVAPVAPTPLDVVDQSTLIPRAELYYQLLQ